MKWLVALGMLIVSSFVAGQNNPVPLVNDALSPTSVAPGSTAFTLTVYGAGFSSSALVNWNGSTRVTSVISPRELKASISASDVAKPGTAWITVTNPAPGGGTSNVVFFPITPGSPATAMAINLVAPNAGVAAVGDFNNDHKLDVVWGSPDSSTGELYLGNGKGGFLAPISSPHGDQVLVGDINGDGKLDLVTNSGGLVIAYLGSGTGTFSQSWSVQEPGGGNTIAMADFNQDGHLDLYIMGYNLGERWFHIYLGQGDGTFILGSENQVGYYAGIPAVADFNGDGILDLAVPEISGNLIDIFVGDGKGNFNEVGTVPAGFYQQVTAADFNHDGKMDLLTDGGCVLLGNGDGTFARAGCGPLSGAGLAGVGDFNGDGLLDVVVLANQGSGWYEALQMGTGDGFFGGFASFSIGTTSVTSGAVGDFNNDGLLDIAAPNGYVLLQTTVSLTPLSLSFGNQNIGTKSPSQPATLTNVGTTALTIQRIKFTGSGAPSFQQTTNCGTTLAAGASCTISAVFKPVAAGPLAAFLSVSYVGTASPQTVAVSGVGLTPPTVSLQPSALTFATQLVGTNSSPQTATLTNAGDLDVTLTSIKATGIFNQTNDCPTTLTVGAACNIQVVFAPTKAGISAGSIVVTDNAKGSPQKIKLSGTGTVAVFSPVAVNFGNQKVGTQSGPATITLTNVGTKTLNISQIALSGANPGDFQESNNCGSAVPGKGSCTITVTFKPTAKGARSASVSVSDDGGASPQTVPLSGTGT